jgi:hypothetical protein
MYDMFCKAWTDKVFVYIVYITKIILYTKYTCEIINIMYLCVWKLFSGSSSSENFTIIEYYSSALRNNCYISVDYVKERHLLFKHVQVLIHIQIFWTTLLYGISF